MVWRTAIILLREDSVARLVGSWKVLSGTFLAGGHPASPGVQLFQNRVVLQVAHSIVRAFRGTSSSSTPVTQSQQYTDRGGVFYAKYHANLQPISRDTAFYLGGPLTSAAYGLQA
jgi:hypothetical protein